MITPEIEIADFQAYVNPNVPEDEKQQFEQAMRAILGDTNEKEETD